MATRYFDSSRNQWRVRWFRADGKRVSRTFSTEQDARAFVPADERAPGTAGPRSTVWKLAESIRDTIRRRSAVDDNGCWIWQSNGGSHGYAQATHRVDGKTVTELMHRVSYEVFVGPIPEGLTIDHLCNVIRCVNPEHLEPVTLAENIRRRDERLAVAR